ncbi:MAG TPA: alcohol dehydrogenase catalytic domain-containing protein, partial [Fimbriimonas sp.]
MRLYRLSEGGLTLSDGPEPRLGAGDVRVRVRACSLNYRDLLVASGRYGRTKPGLIPLSDGAGEVVEAGSDVQTLQPGDAVAGTFFTRWL